MELDDFFIVETDERPACITRIYESNELSEERCKDRSGRYIDVLILVKTAPQPSEKYVETVCVAGVALDPLRLVRLYPIAFRLLDEINRFKKYSIINLKVEDSPKDPRYESLHIDASTLSTLRILDKWKDRAAYVEMIPTENMCDILAKIREDSNATSLAVVEPKEVTGIEITPHKGWSEKQQEVIRRHLARRGQTTLDGKDEYIPILKAPAYDVKLQYKCQSPTCKGHKQGILDWELRALQRHEKDEPSEQLETLIRERFLTNPTKPGKRLLLFVGNQSNALKRGTFSILGMYYPKEVDAQPVLF